MMRNLLSILLVLCVLPALAESPAAGPGHADVELAVSEENALTLTARVGQTVRIRLAGNATTGYEWTLTSQTDEKGRACKILTPAGAIEYRPASAEGRVGVGGEFFATFRAARPGLAKLAFAYQRPWEKDKDPIKTFAVSVRVIAAESRKAPCNTK
ncbi:MAG: protease inhibitor I42 family protein [Phycisphaerae bacterium]|nr:protease inhibitor I42 family protein [Phycisphaerae bacterium]